MLVGGDARRCSSARHGSCLQDDRNERWSREPEDGTDGARLNTEMEFCESPPLCSHPCFSPATLPVAMHLRRPLSAAATHIQENPPTKRRGSLRGPETFADGRRCDSCTAYLSKYNPDTTCAPCQGPMSDQSDLDVVAVMEAVFG